MIPSRRILLPLAALATAVLLAGCEASCSTGEDSINADEAAATIEKQYLDQTGIKMTEITCESGDPEVGAKFTCQAKNESDVSLDIEATVTKVDEGSSDAKFDWETVTATAGPTTFTSTALDALQGIGRAVDSIECPGGTVIEEGNVIDCTGTMDDGSKRVVKITLTDGNGNVNVKLLGPA